VPVPGLDSSARLNEFFSDEGICVQERWLSIHAGMVKDWI
jgi:hypothetical protein